MPKTGKVAAFLAQSRAFYAEAFAHRRKSELADAMSEWGELDDAEQSFAIAHLAYLDLEAQAVTHQLLTQVRDLLDELAEAFTLAVEVSLEEPPPPEDEEQELMDTPPMELPLSTDVIEAEPNGSSP